MAAANSSSSDSDTGQIGRNSGPELVADVTYRAVPHDPQTIDVSATPVWWVRFELIADPTVRFGLDINGEVVLGRSGTRTGFVDLSTFDSGNFGVSRQHAMLRPTASNLYVLDLGSTNGTRRNGIDIGIKTPYGLANGDKLTFGHLEFFVRIVERPISQTAMLRGKADLSDALVQMAKAITSQLDIAEVLNQALEMALTLTEAGESAIWLIDEQSGDLLLVADLGIEDQAMRQVSLPVSDTMVGKVIESGQAMTASSEGGQEQIKVKTGYLVEAVTYVPLKLGGVAFGVLMVAHRESGRVFDAKDHEMLEAIADFAAIAVQNARIYEATDSALAERVEEVTSLNHALSHDLRNVLGSIMGYASLLTGENSADAKSARYAKGIMQASTSAAELIDQLLAMARVRDVSDLEGRTCNLVDVVKRAVSDLQGSALEKSITTEIHVEGAVRGNHWR